MVVLNIRWIKQNCIKCFTQYYVIIEYVEKKIDK